MKAQLQADSESKLTTVLSIDNRNCLITMVSNETCAKFWLSRLKKNIPEQWIWKVLEAQLIPL